MVTKQGPDRYACPQIKTRATRDHASFLFLLVRFPVDRTGRPAAASPLISQVSIAGEQPLLLLSTQWKQDLFRFRLAKVQDKLTPRHRSEVLHRHGTDTAPVVAVADAPAAVVSASHWPPAAWHQTGKHVLCARRRDTVVRPVSRRVPVRCGARSRADAQTHPPPGWPALCVSHWQAAGTKHARGQERARGREPNRAERGPPSTCPLRSAGIVSQPEDRCVGPAPFGFWILYICG